MTSFYPTILNKKLGREEFDYALLASVLKHYGYLAPAKKIHELMKAGVILGIKKGLYVLAPEYSQTPLCKESLANLIYGPSCISLESALSYYGLIPERVHTITNVTPKRDKRFETPVGNFTYRYLSPSKYPEGIDLVWIDPKHSVFMASKEKALCDYLVLNKIAPFENFKETRQFLFEDLRVNEANLMELDQAVLYELNRCYKSKTVDALLVYLET